VGAGAGGAELTVAQHSLMSEEDAHAMESVAHRRIP